MFADYIKMAAKAALIAVVIAGIITLLNIVTIPSFDISALTVYLSVAYTFAVHWCPAFSYLWPIALALITLEIGILTFRISAIAWKWVFKINE